MPPAARVTDLVTHPLPGKLTPGPGSPDVLIGFLPAWRGIPAEIAEGLQVQQAAGNDAIVAAEAATAAAAGTPGLPAAEAAEQTTKASVAASMGASMSAAPAATGADIHQCDTPLPIPPHGPGVVIDASPTVLINHLPAARQGDSVLEAVGPPDPIAVGCLTVIIGPE